MAMRLHNRPARPHLSREEFTAVKDMLARFRPDEFTLAMVAMVTIALVSALLWRRRRNFSKA